LCGGSQPLPSRLTKRQIIIKKYKEIKHAKRYESKRKMD
jgi:hypothetical protein